MLGVVRLHDDPNGEGGEFAILVRSRLKGHGLGWLMMKHMIAYAQEKGLETVHGQVLAENATMLQMCAELGLSSRRRRRRTRRESGHAPAARITCAHRALKSAYVEPSTHCATTHSAHETRERVLDDAQRSQRKQRDCLNRLTRGAGIGRGRRRQRSEQPLQHRAQNCGRGDARVLIRQMAAGDGRADASLRVQPPARAGIPAARHRYRHRPVRRSPPRRARVHAARARQRWRDRRPAPTTVPALHRPQHASRRLHDPRWPKSVQATKCAFDGK